VCGSLDVIRTRAASHNYTHRWARAGQGHLCASELILFKRGPSGALWGPRGPARDRDLGGVVSRKCLSLPGARAGQGHLCASELNGVFRGHLGVPGGPRGTETWVE
jgi:hypothetical protein